MRKNKLLKFLGQFMIVFAKGLVPLVSEGCRTWWYQPEEPKGFEDFVKSIK